MKCDRESQHARPETSPFQKCSRLLKSRRRLDETGSSVRRKRLYCVPRRRLDETGLIGRSVSSLSEVKGINLLLSEKKKTEERGRKNDDYIADRFDRDRAKVTKRVVIQHRCRAKNLVWKTPEYGNILRCDAGVA